MDFGCKAAAEIIDEDSYLRYEIDEIGKEEHASDDDDCTQCCTDIEVEISKKEGEQFVQQYTSHCQSEYLPQGFGEERDLQFKSNKEQDCEEV